MSQSRTGIMAVSLLAVLLAGCQSERFSRLESRSPEPLAPAPAGSVASSELPPPSGETALEFPEAPSEETDMAAIDEEAVSDAPELTPARVAGVWTVSVEGQTCRVATPQTKYGEGFRAGPLQCPPPLDTVKSWSVSGKQLAFYDEAGTLLARLYASGEESFSGQTAGGMPISLSR